jgi:hypothetical protein
MSLGESRHVPASAGRHGVKRMALGLLFGSALGFGSTLLVALALASGGAGLPKPSESLSQPSEGLPKPSEILSQPSGGISKPLKFTCNYATYTSNGVDFQQTKYVACLRGGALVVEPARLLGPRQRDALRRQTRRAG